MTRTPVLTMGLLLAAAFSIFAQDSLLTATLKANAHELRLENGRFAGPAAELLETAIPGCQFLLVGEQHGIQEVGDFTEVLFRTAHPHGFQYLALETDPFIAEKIEQLAGEGLEALQAFNRELPFAIPFYLNKEDFGLLQEAVENSEAKGPAIWGLDYVFGAGERYIFRALADIAPNENARQLAQEYHQLGVEALNKFMSTGNPREGLLLKLTKEDFTEFYEAFGQEEESLAYRMIHGMELAQEVFLHWFEGRIYLNNAIRGNIMKENFRRYYRYAQAQGEEVPRVAFKFGAYHLQRGLTPTHIYDIGNLASEVAALNGMESLHIRFSGLKGRSYNMLAGPQAFDNTKSLLPEIKAVVESELPENGWLLLDLRPLRPLIGKDTPEELKQLVFGYDLWVLVPEALPLTPLPMGGR